jgi:glycosyltransferase involved in cell wall biosynthesis
LNNSNKAKLKIAIVNKFFYLKGGQDNVALSDAKMLENEGHEIAFFSMKHHNNPANYKYEKYFIDYVELSNNGKEYSFFDKLKIAKNFIWNNQAAKNFESFINDFKPDIIHCHGIAHQITPSILPIARKYNIPVVQTLHDYQPICPNYTLLLGCKTNCTDYKCIKGNYLHCIYNKCVKKSLRASVLSSLELFFNRHVYRKYKDRFISPSKFLRERIIDSGVDENQIVHIPNSIDVKKFEPEYQSKGYFVYIGRLSFEKGLMTLIKTFEQIPEANLKIIGTGSEEIKLIEYKEQKGLQNIEFLGYKTFDELKTYFDECEAMILPSEWCENAPISIIETFSFGKPVIASNLGGISEMVINDYNGYTFTAGNKDELVKIIQKFLVNNNLYKKLGENGREFALKNYIEEDHYNSLIELYYYLIANKCNVAERKPEKTIFYDNTEGMVTETNYE